MEDCNEIILTGKVVAKYVSPKSVVLTLMIRQYGDTIFPGVVCFGQMKTLAENTVEVDSNITVHGNIQSTKADESRLVQREQMICADTITFAKSNLAARFGMIADNKMSYAYRNEFYLKGKVHDTFRINDHIIGIHVTTVTTHNSRPCVMLSNEHTDEWLTKLIPGRQICISGRANTSKKMDKSKGREVHVTSFNVDELALIEESAKEQ